MRAAVTEHLFIVKDRRGVYIQVTAVQSVGGSQQHKPTCLQLLLKYESPSSALLTSWTFSLEQHLKLEKCFTKEADRMMEAFCVRP